MTATKTRPEAFQDLDDHGDPERAYDVLAFKGNERGYTLTATRMPYYDSILEFVQVDMPDGTTAYFTPDIRAATHEESSAYLNGHRIEDPTIFEVRETAEGLETVGMRAGPFGGGYSWAVPKYVVRAAGEMLREAFPLDAEEVRDAGG